MIKNDSAAHVKKRLDLMDVHELSELVKISVSSLYTLISQKRIPHIKVGRLVRFSPDRILEWLNENKVEPQND